MKKKILRSVFFELFLSIYSASLLYYSFKQYNLGSLLVSMNFVFWLVLLGPTIIITAKEIASALQYEKVALLINIKNNSQISKICSLLITLLFIVPYYFRLINFNVADLAITGIIFLVVKIIFNIFVLMYTWNVLILKFILLKKFGVQEEA